MYREIAQEEIKIDTVLGYQYFIDKKHPLSSKGVGKVYYHRHLASIMADRWLESYEIVHHKDGNKTNNCKENLEILSNSIHTKRHQAERYSQGVELKCPICNKLFTVCSSISDKRITCSRICLNLLQGRWDISKDDLEILIWNKPYTQIAKEYPISDVGAKKKAKALGCKLPPPYFFNKSEEYRKTQRTINNIPDLSTQQSSKL